MGRLAWSVPVACTTPRQERYLPEPFVLWVLTGEGLTETVTAPAATSPFLAGWPLGVDFFGRRVWLFRSNIAHTPPFWLNCHQSFSSSTRHQVAGRESLPVRSLSQGSLPLRATTSEIGPVSEKSPPEAPRPELREHASRTFRVADSGAA